MNYLVTI